MIRGQKRALDKQPSVNVDLNASIHNRFDIEVIDARTGKVKQRAQAENVICDYLWSVLSRNTTSNDGKWSSYIHYGSGSGTPAATDTSLFNYVGYGTPSTSDDVRSFDAINHVASLRRKIILSEQTAVGVTITEVGISNSTSGSICTHAMLEDMNGNQISIVKTDTDIINIYATIFVHWSGENDAWFAFANYEDSNGLFEWLLGTATCYGAAPDAYLTGNSAETVTAYRSSITFPTGEKSILIGYDRIAASSGNNAGGYTFLASDHWLLRIHSSWFSPPPITGESIGTGDGTTRDFKTAFRDIKNATVYVDGVETQVTVDSTFPLLPASDIPTALILRNLDGTLFVTTNWGPGAVRGSAVYVRPPSPIILENPNNSLFGIQKLVPYNYQTSYERLSLYASDDMISWTTISENIDGEISIPEELQRSRYFKAINNVSGGQNYWQFVSDVETGYNIHFAEAPADGAVITADYTPGVIAKDENHVFDFQIKFTFGEYTE